MGLPELDRELRSLEKEPLTEAHKHVSAKMESEEEVEVILFKLVSRWPALIDLSDQMRRQALKEGVPIETASLIGNSVIVAAATLAEMIDLNDLQNRIDIQ